MSFRFKLQPDPSFRAVSSTSSDFQMTPTARARWFRKKVKVHVRNAELSPTARLLWLILESYANMDGTSCHPSVETLMKDLGASKNTVEKYLRELKKAEKIDIGKKKVATGWVNLYFIRYELTYDYSGEGLPQDLVQGVAPNIGALPGINRPEPSIISQEVG